jgi:hypothetical protein
MRGDRKPVAIYYSQHIFELEDPICRGAGNSVVSFEDEPWKEQKEFPGL